MSEDVTIRAEALSSAPTLVARGAALETLTLGGAARTTVLPRLSFAGNAPQVVVDRRGRFEEVTVLGRGGVGEVVLAEDRDIDRRVALKRLLPESDDAASLVRFAEEVRTLGALDHPNIVPVHDVGVDPDGKLFYVMKYIEGETLETVITRLAAGDPAYHTRYPFARRLEIFKSVLRAVQYAHSRGYVHRDLKPANIMVGRFGEVVVMDWGLARRLDGVNDVPGAPGAAAAEPSSKLRTAEGSLLGTPAYMSPEQARGEVDLIDERSDVYALGVICHEFMTLRHYLAAHDSVPAAIVGVNTVDLPLATTVRHPAQGPVPAEIAHFIKHCVVKDREARFRTVTAALDRLAEIDAGTYPVECPVTFMKRVLCVLNRSTDQHPVAMVMGLMGVVGVGIGALVGVLIVIARRVG